MRLKTFNNVQMIAINLTEGQQKYVMIHNFQALRHAFRL